MFSRTLVVALVALGYSSQLTSAADAICNGDPANVIVPHPDPADCAGYYECFNGNATLLHCPGDLLYNDQIKSCDHPETVSCVPVTIAPPGGNDAICNGDPPNVIIPHADPDDCSSYYECYNGRASHLRCDNGFLFNDLINSCDYADNVHCRVFVPECPPGVIVYIPDPYDCAKYVECYLGTPYIVDCPSNLYFDAVSSHCVPLADATCGAALTTPNPICDGVLPGDVYLAAYPQNCTLFYECRGADLSVLSCPPGLYFDDEIDSCEWPGLSGCTDGSSPPPPPDIPDVHDPRCNGTYQDYFPDPVSCSKYIECYMNVSYEMDCPQGLFFDPLLKVCVDGAHSTCGSGPTVAPPPTLPPDGPDARCPDDPLDGNRYLYPYPHDCTKFIECWMGIYTEVDCPNDPQLYFNPTLLVCDYPYHAGCDPNA